MASDCPHLAALLHLKTENILQWGEQIDIYNTRDSSQCAADDLQAEIILLKFKL